jgi:hypothetical protein
MLSKIETISEIEKSCEEIDPDGYSQFSNIASDSVQDEVGLLTRDLKGLIFVADDQHINLEIIKQHMRTIELADQCRYFVNG